MIITTQDNHRPFFLIPTVALLWTGCRLNGVTLAWGFWGATLFWNRQCNLNS